MLLHVHEHTHTHAETALTQYKCVTHFYLRASIWKTTAISIACTDTHTHTIAHTIVDHAECTCTDEKSARCRNKYNFRVF